MFDIEHDSPVPIHEQITNQIRAHVASGALRAGAVLPEYRAFAQQLLTNPHVVARAYADLQAEGVLVPLTPDPSPPKEREEKPGGSLAVSPGAEVICRERMRTTACEHLRRAVSLAFACGLGDAEIENAVAAALAASKVQPLSAAEILQAIKKPTHEPSHRASQAIQDLSRQKGP